MFNITVLSSSNGGNFKNIVQKSKMHNYRIIKLITDRICGAAEKAQMCNIPYTILDRHASDFDQAMANCIPASTDLILLCGYLSVIKDPILSSWSGSIVNVHPSLLPRYGGLGMYGIHVHEAVMRAKETVTGCTSHFVEAGVDTGKIILQREIQVNYEWTPRELGYHVYLEEEKLYIETILKIMKERGVDGCD